MSLFDLSGLGAWRELPFFDTELPAIETLLAKERAEMLPPAPQVFSALEMVSPGAVRVVILGQDPYPTPGHAHGLAFSAEADVRPLPRSLSNIFTEMRDDIGAAPASADLRFWAEQGVLLLNTILTVPCHRPLGHAHLGWQALSAQIFERIACQPCVYLLWGTAAQKAARSVDGQRNLKIETAHPSPLSARRGFFGSRPFSRSNAWLQARGLDAIRWSQPPEET